MFSLLVVEDEQWIRRGLCETIDWANEGIRLSGEAADGEEAMRFMESHSPDIVITDIVMPGMDGITFLKSLREQKMSSEVIIMSGYSDFEYARTALKNGAFDYVLKPIHEQNMLSVIRRCVQELKQKRQAESEMNRLARSARETLFLARQRLFDMLLTEAPYSPGWLTEQMKALQVELEPGRIRTFVAKIVDWGDKAENDRDRALMLYALCNMLEETGSRFGPAVAFPIHNGKTSGEADVAMLHTDNGSAGGGQPGVAGELPGLIEEVGRMLGLRISVGYSREADIGRLSVMLEEALHAAAHWFYEGGGSLRGAESLASAMQTDLPYCGPAGWDGRFASALRMADAKLIEQLVRELGEHIRASRASHLPLTIRRGLKLLFQNVNQKCDALHRRSQCGEPAASEPLKLPPATADAFENVLLENLSRAMPGDRPVRNRKWIVERALQYIEANRGKIVTMNDVAAHLYLNHSYFSKIFREEMGETFSKYVLQSRIETAKRLLKETPLKIYEIAGQLGYTDIRHFTKMFKESEGITPAQFRDYGL
ncbi:response regulator [Paenibacillus lycopersici]|uniref:Response regulator n=1 Tax=Paenibacillus lycopersici TaxID=2704462 RepID=A0A6C0G4R9_9BACL|nr:response regulator [Paenibacillus lycopersici]QHT63223.1 response regulator [Paenibacillus lycopersici]